MHTEIIRVVEGKIVVSNELQIFISELTRQTQAIVVHDQETYAEAIEVCKKKDDAVKVVMAAAEPERLALRSRLEQLLADRNKVVEQITSVTAQIEKNAREWNIGEREAARKEQEKMNKGQRPENRVVVQPNLPSVPGKRIIMHYRYEVTDISKMKREYMRDNEVKINEKLRKDANIKKSEKEIGGIKARVE